MAITNSCECDNTHEANDTVCQWCWERGRRRWADPDAEHDCDYCEDTGHYVNDFSGLVGKPCGYCAYGDSLHEQEKADV